ncbi:uncharacterized protein LOC117608586 [Osmia lignaria lignaria]|uniref:uncharacterized protein LOC117608586 n=1 Tax=Osmia lignaria lignaria TaxID=1437193 RepID=UPI001478B119|nr:ankyrin-1-like [Osmia lignaria]
MTAAYTNNSTSQEQNVETAGIINKTLNGKKEQVTPEENTEITSAEMIKVATGGQDQQEIPVNQERSSLCVEELNEQKDEDSGEYKKSIENREYLDDTDANEDVISNTNEMKNEVSKDCEPSASKSLSNLKVEAFLIECDSQDAMSRTRGNDFYPKDSFKLQELQTSVENIITETSDISNNPESYNGSFEDIDIFNDPDETYDPESELNFHEAVRAGNAKCIAALLASDSVQNLDEPDWNVSGDPPLLVAATNHCLPVLSLLLANGCDPAVRSPRGETALHRVILNGGPGNVLQFVGELLKHGCPSGVKEAGGGLTALHVLTRQLAHAQGSKSLHHNFEAALKTLDLLARAGPVNAKDHQGRSALHILASSTIFDNNHRTEIEALIETLLAAGADPSLKNDRGETPLHECLECGALNIAFLLISHTPAGIMSRYGETPLHIASRKNYVDMVAKLLEHGEDPSVQDAGGNTPLHLASARGFHQTVSLLVTSPLAQLEKLNTEGLTALQVAAESGFVNAVRLLLKAGADPSQTVHYSTTILHRHPDISILIDHEMSRRRQLAA